MMENLLDKLTSRKFWAYIASLVAAASGLFLGEINFPLFVAAVVAASGTYQLSEGIADGKPEIGR